MKHALRDDGKAMCAMDLTDIFTSSRRLYRLISLARDIYNDELGSLHGATSAPCDAEAYGCSACVVVNERGTSQVAAYISVHGHFPADDACACLQHGGVLCDAFDVVEAQE